jgi:DNA-binding NarL/FixJ family response regulator
MRAELGFLADLRAGVTVGLPAADTMSTVMSDPAQIKDQAAADHTSPKTPLRILVADDHEIVREGVKAILEREGFKVVAEASNGEEAVGRTLDLQPDVAVLDLSMPRKNGIEAAKEILATIPEAKTILLTVHLEDYYVRQALRGGIQGYVLKNRSSEDLVQAIYDVCQGMIYLSSGISPEVVREFLDKTG